MKELMAVLWVLLALNVSAQTKQIREVRIKSLWAGLGKPSQTNLMLKAGQLQEVRGVTLEKALMAEPIGELSLDNLGITEAWLAANADQAARLGHVSRGARNQQDLFRNTWLDLHSMAGLVREVIESDHTDDYPLVEVTVVFAGGETWTIWSQSQTEWMLPWRVRTSHGVTSTYNADIARAIGAYLPKKENNRYRLAGDGIVSNLARHVTYRIRDRWNLLDVQNRAANATEIIQREFLIVSERRHPLQSDRTHGLHLSAAFAAGSRIS